MILEFSFLQVTATCQGDGASLLAVFKKKSNGGLFADTTLNLGNPAD